MREQVEHRRRIGRDGGADEHVAELAAGRIGDDPLDVVLGHADAAGEHRGGAADHADHGERVGACSNSGDRRTTMKTPAVTIVAAWISAETGVGPSIASGSQVCRPSCADLPIAPINSRIQAKVSAGTRQPRKSITVLTWCGAAANTVSKLSDPKITKTVKMPRAKPKSPTRLTTNASIAA